MIYRAGKLLQPANELSRSRQTEASKDENEIEYETNLENAGILETTADENLEHVVNPETVVLETNTIEANVLERKH